MSEKMTLPVIDLSAVVDIKISGYFYNKIQSLLMIKASEVSEEEFTKVLTKLKESDSKIDSLYESEIHILLALVSAIEKGAKEQNKITYKELDLEKDLE